MWILRAMEEENGLPKLGTSATTLGIRKGKDIVVDTNGLVHRPNFVAGEPNGLSCAPTVTHLPRFVVPMALGGRNTKTKVWKILADDLGPELVAQEDGGTGSRRHISIGPARSMPADEYQRAIQATRAKWQIV